MNMIKPLLGIVFTLFVSTAVLTAAPLEVPPEMLQSFKNMSSQDQIDFAKQYGFELPRQNSVGKSAEARPGQDILEFSQEDSASEISPDPDPEKFGEADHSLIFDASTDEFYSEVHTVDELPVPLPRFGSSLFDREISNYEAVDNVPVPATYRLGVGDEINVLLFGKDQLETKLIVSRDGTINFPKLGPIIVTGLMFAELQEMISSRVAQQFIGTKVFVSMGRLRSITLYLSGQVKSQGSFSVPAATTLTQALYVGGGISEHGSYRNILIKRSGKTVASYDLYDLLLYGNLDNDIQFQSGDVVFVPLAKIMVSVSGEVLVPAIFELKESDNFAEVLRMAGGARPTASLETVGLKRFLPGKSQPLLLSLDLNSPKIERFELKDGDELDFRRITNFPSNFISIKGAVVRPGNTAWKEGLKVSEIFGQVHDSLLPTADASMALIIRSLDSGNEVEVLGLRLQEALQKPGSSADIHLRPRDEILVFEQSGAQAAKNRRALLMELVEKLVQQGRLSERLDIVKLEGAFDEAGYYPYMRGMRVSDIVLLAGRGGSFAEQVDLNAAAIVRQKNTGNGLEVLKLNLWHVLSSPGSDADLSLEPSDTLLIFNKASKGSNRQELFEEVVTRLSLAGSDSFYSLIEITGKVVEPGIYPMLKRPTLKNQIDLAGGLLDSALPEDIEISRVSVDSESSASFEIISTDLSNKEHLNPRDVINVKARPYLLNKGKIEVAGEVRFPGSYEITRGETLSSIIRRAGGFTELAYVQASRYYSDTARKLQYTEVERLATDVIRSIPPDSSGSREAALGNVELIKKSISGRVAVDIGSILAGDTTNDLLVAAGDSFFVPRFVNQIVVMGEVLYPGVYGRVEGLQTNNYLELAGGLGKFADKKRIYIIRPNGSIAVPDQKIFGLLSGFSKNQLEPGSVIIVPPDSSYSTALDRIGEVTRVLFQSTTSIATLLAARK
jgi:polysaccharide biosynthesis/export protein